MILEQYGTPFRSRPITHSSGSTEDFPLDFLRPAQRMAAPVITHITVHGRFSHTPSGADHQGEDSYKGLQRLEVFDSKGSFFDYPGTLVRIDEQLERGSRQFDPADITQSTTQTSYDVFWEVVCHPELRSLRPEDFHVELVRLLENGGIRLRMQDFPTGAPNSGTYRVYVWVKDERKPEAKSRWVKREINVSLDEQSFPLGTKGSLRYALLAEDTGETAGYGGGVDDISVVRSRALEYQDIDIELLNSIYRQMSPDRASDDEILAATQNVAPLVVPGLKQRIGQMPVFTSFDLDIGSGNRDSTMRMMLNYIGDRHPGLAAQVFGYSNEHDYAAALQKAGKVAAQGKGNRSIKAWDPLLARHLPVRIG